MTHDAVTTQPLQFYVVSRIPQEKKDSNHKKVQRHQRCDNAVEQQTLEKKHALPEETSSTNEAVNQKEKQQSSQREKKREENKCSSLSV
jgi:hypothetical protein